MLRPALPDSSSASASSDLENRRLVKRTYASRHSLPRPPPSDPSRYAGHPPLHSSSSPPPSSDDSLHASTSHSATLPNAPDFRRRPLTLPSRRLASSANKRVKREEPLEYDGKGKCRAVQLPSQASKKLEQTHLTLSSKPVAVTCKKCQMAYIHAAIEDEEVHRDFCKRATGGIEWPGGDSATSYLTVVQENVQLGKGKAAVEGKILKVDGRVQGRYGRKLAEIASVINQSLSAASLSEEETKSSKFFVFVSTGYSATTKPNRVLGCAIVTPISRAYRVAKGESGKSFVEDSLLRFGEDDGAIFCSPTAQPALLGVHRIWSSPSHRRLGLAAQLLDAAAEHAIYGCSIQLDGPPSRRDSVAFSQPSNAGQNLFTAWTGTSEFLIFVDC